MQIAIRRAANTPYYKLIRFVKLPSFVRHFLDFVINAPKIPTEKQQPLACNSVCALTESTLRR